MAAKILPSYTHAGVSIVPGLIVTDGKIKLYVESIEQDEEQGGVQFVGTQVISQPYPRKGQLNARIDATRLRSVGKLNPAIIKRLGLKE